MFGCGVTALRNISKILFVVLYYWIPGSANHHIISMAEKANYDENKLRISDYNDYIVD